MLILLLSVRALKEKINELVQAYVNCVIRLHCTTYSITAG